MKVLWVSHTGDAVGGAELGMREAIRGLRSRGVDVCVVLPSQGTIASSLEKLGATVEIIPLAWWIANDPMEGRVLRVRRLLANLKCVPSLVRLFKRIGADLVVTNSLASPAGAFAARWARIPHVWYLHEMFGKEGHGWVFDLGQKLSLKLIDRLSAIVMVNSQLVFNSYARQIRPSKLRLVYYGVEVPEQPHTNRVMDHTLRLIQVGSLIPGKRPEDALRAMAHLIAKGLDVRLTLLGFGETAHGAWVRDLAAELDLLKHVDFIGLTPDPFRHITAADLVVVCSHGEAFGRVTVEAMKLGRPVLGARSGNTPELIKDGTNGHLFDFGDPDDLAAKIEMLYRDRTQLERLGHAAKEWATRTFTQEKYTAAMMNVLREACAVEEALISEGPGGVDG